MQTRHSLSGSWFARNSVMGLALLALAGCNRPPPAAEKTEETKAPSSSATAPSAAAASASAAAPATPATPAPPPAPAVAVPRAHSEVLGMVDFTKFPKIEGATRQGCYPLNASFTIPKKSAADVQRAVDAMTAFLSAEGWKHVPDTLATGWDDSGGTALYQKNGTSAEASAGISRGFPTGEDINAGIFLYGEVDSRTLPRPPGSMVEREGFTYSKYISPMPLMEVRKFFKERYAALGWTEYRDNPPVGHKPPMEELERTQSFMKNGAKIGYRFEKKDPQTEVSVSVGLLERHLPLPPWIADVIKWQDSPVRLICEVKATPPEVFAWFQTEMGKLGWTAKEVPPVEARTVRHEFQKTGAKPLYLDCLLSGKATLMIMKE